MAKTGTWTWTGNGVWHNYEKKHCLQCNAEYQPKCPCQKYCSRKCLNEAYKPILYAGKHEGQNKNRNYKSNFHWPPEMNQRFNKALSDSAGWERLRNLLRGIQEISV